MFKSIKNVSWLLLLFMALAVAPAVQAHHCKGPHAGDDGCESDGGGDDGGGSSSYALTITFTDTFDMTGEQIERIGSDSAGPYVHGQDDVRAEMETNVSDPGLRQLNFDTENTNRSWVREIYFNYADTFSCPDGGCLSAFGTETEGLGRIMSIIGGCLAEGNPLHAMSEGENQACYWKINGPKTDGVEGWQTRFNPAERTEATLVTVTCTGTHSDGKCGRWEVLGGSTDVAATFTLEKFRGKTVKVWQGSYFMPFQFVMERQ